MAALEQTNVRPPTPQVAWIHQIPTTLGTGNSATMVMVFTRSFVLFMHLTARDSPVRVFKRCDFLFYIGMPHTKGNPPWESGGCKVCWDPGKKEP
jgi:hypothetical protein